MLVIKILILFKDTMKHLKWKKISQLTTKTNAKWQQRGITQQDTIL
jgi:hypothetical protein